MAFTEINTHSIDLAINEDARNAVLVAGDLLQEYRGPGTNHLEPPTNSRNEGPDR